LFRCCPFDPLPLLIGKRSEAPLNVLPIQDGHGKQSNTAAGTTLGAGKIAEEKGFRTLKPPSGLFKHG